MVDIPENVTIRLDNQTYRNSIIQLPIQPGIHTIMVESPGYETQTITYDFSKEEEYIVSVKLVEVENINLEFSALLKKEQVETDLFIAGVPYGKTPNQLQMNG